MDKIGTTIPERHQEFCRKIARLAREHGLHAFSGSFNPGFRDEWSHRIQFAWDAGRHQEDSGEITISSNVDIRGKIDVGDPA